MEEELRKRRCCFTGHRPEKIYIPPHEAKEKLRSAIRQAIDDGFITFISGMARGTDMWAAEIVLEERKNNENIRLICASPFEGFEKSWSQINRLAYNNILNKADLVKYICPKYSMSCFQTRNKWMVDHSSRVIAFFNGSSGGTKNTIDYAKKQNIETIIL